jgi:DNA-binding CsgD family transcriptional regulator
MFRRNRLALNDTETATDALISQEGTPVAPQKPVRQEAAGKYQPMEVPPEVMANRQWLEDKAMELKTKTNLSDEDWERMSWSERTARIIAPYIGMGFLSRNVPAGAMYPTMDPENPVAPGGFQPMRQPRSSFRGPWDPDIQTTQMDIGTVLKPNIKEIANEGVTPIEVPLSKILREASRELKKQANQKDVDWRALRAQMTEGRSENPANMNTGKRVDLEEGMIGEPNSWTDTPSYRFRLDSNGRPVAFIAKKIADNPMVAEALGPDVIGVSILDPYKSQAAMKAGEELGSGHIGAGGVQFFRNRQLAEEYVEKAVTLKGKNSYRELQQLQYEYAQKDLDMYRISQMSPEAAKKELSDMVAEKRRSEFKVIENNKNPTQEPQAANRPTKEQIELQRQQQVEQRVRREANKINVGPGKGILNDNKTEVLNMLEKGITPSQIAKIYDITPLAVRNWIRRKGINRVEDILKKIESNKNLEK